MKAKGWRSQQHTTPNPTPTYLPKPRPISFKTPKSKSKSKSKSYPHLPPFINPSFTDRRHFDIHTTTVYSITSATTTTTTTTTWPYAAVDATPQLLHPLTFKPHRYTLPLNPNLFKHNTKCLTSFDRTDFAFDKLVIPPPRSSTVDGGAMVVLHGGGHLVGLLPVVSEPNWVELSDERFDDVVVFLWKTYVVDREGNLYVINYNVKSRDLRLGGAVITKPVLPGPGRGGWRKRIVVERGHLFVVVRAEEEVFRVYKLIKGSPDEWEDAEEFEGGVLFVSKESCFFMDWFGGREYEDCIVFSESGFPRYGSDGGWEYSGEDGFGVFRMSDGRYGRVGEFVDFPEIDWSPPSWVFDVGPCSSSHSRSQSKGEPNEDDGGVQSELKDSNTKDDKEKEGMEFDSDHQDQEQEESSDSDVEDQDDGKIQRDSDSQETKDEEMQSDANIEGDTSLQEGVPPSLFASISVVEEEVTKTFLRISGGDEPMEKESSRKNATTSAPRACTSSSTTKGYNGDSATAKFEGFDIRSDLVPTLQKIWRNHGNIIVNSTMRSSYLIARALESLATMVQILENNSVESLSDCQADYLSSTLSDLRIMSFNVDWLSSFVEKAVKLHKNKCLVDSLNKLNELSSQVKERRAILLDEVAKLTEEENKLKKEMTKVSELIPLSGQVKFDEPFGSGLT